MRKSDPYLRPSMVVRGKGAGVVHPQNSRLICRANALDGKPRSRSDAHVPFLNFELALSHLTLPRGHFNKINHSDGLIALLSRLSLRSNARHSNFVALLDKLEALQVVADGQP